MRFENKDSGLAIKEYEDKEQGVGKFLNYIRNGGGEWTLFGRIMGKDTKVTSGSNKTVVCLPAILEEGEDILDKIDKAVQIKEVNED